MGVQWMLDMEVLQEITDHAARSAFMGLEEAGLLRDGVSAIMAKDVVRVMIRSDDDRDVWVFHHSINTTAATGIAILTSRQEDT